MQILELPKSKLALHDEELIKLGSNDSVLARHPTTGIVALRLEKTQQYAFATLILSVFTGLALVAYRYVASPGWSWTAIIVCLGICGFTFFGIEGRQLVVETTSGTVRYPLADLFEEAEGFVLSANSLLQLEREESEDKDLISSDEPV
jgi:hypothetical protein